MILFVYFDKKGFRYLLVACESIEDNNEMIISFCLIKLNGLIFQLIARFHICLNLLAACSILKGVNVPKFLHFHKMHRDY